MNSKKGENLMGTVTRGLGRAERELGAIVFSVIVLMAFCPIALEAENPHIAPAFMIGGLILHGILRLLTQKSFRENTGSWLVAMAQTAFFGGALFALFANSREFAAFMLGYHFQDSPAEFFVPAVFLITMLLTALYAGWNFTNAVIRAFDSAPSTSKRVQEPEEQYLRALLFMATMVNSALWVSIWWPR